MSRLRSPFRRSRPLQAESLESRLLMTAQLPGLGDATRQHLSIYIDGVATAIPTNIGLFADHKELVTTRFGNGVIHVTPAEAQNAPTELPTLGDFFETWRERAGLIGNNPNAVFSSTNILGNQVDATHTLRMFVNGVPSTEFENHRLGFNEEIVIVYDAITNTAPTLAELPNVTVTAGAPLVVPLDGFDADFDALYFDVTSSRPALQTTLIEGRNLRMDVPNFGDMVFQLFDKLAPRPAGRIAELAESGFYDDVIFHRVINNFMIQGGDPTGTGAGGSDLGDFDDQFHLDLQHTGRGLLSMAKSGDDTNDSQFFVTEVATRHLDFNHSIFGRLIEGDAVREAISNVQTGSNDRPTNTVKIDAMTVYDDPSNRALMLKAPIGMTGTSTVTVRLSDGQAVVERSFTVTIQADATNNTPFLAELPKTLYVVDDDEARLPLRAYDAEGNQIFYQITSSPNLTASITPTQVTPTNQVAESELRVKRIAGFAGSATITVRAMSQPNVSSEAQRDSQLLTVQVITGELPGDANDDNRIDLSDMQIVRGLFGFEGPNSPADLNGDQVVNLADINIVRAHFGLAREAASPAPYVNFTPQSNETPMIAPVVADTAAYDALFGIDASVTALVQHDVFVGRRSPRRGR
jgi:cyclophilin family peptidyl-prolyl cis-trans isomerase